MQLLRPTCNTLIKCGREFPVSIFSALSFGLDLNTAAVFNEQVGYVNIDHFSVNRDADWLSQQLN